MKYILPRGEPYVTYGSIAYDFTNCVDLQIPVFVLHLLNFSVICYSLICDFL
jgi:hypothetical protein